MSEPQEIRGSNVFEFRAKSVTISEGPALYSGDGGGTSGGMEARIARLEADVTEMKADLKKTGQELSEARISVATIAEKVANLPSKDYVSDKLRNHAILICTVMGLIVAISTLILRFAGK